MHSKRELTHKELMRLYKLNSFEGGIDAYFKGEKWKKFRNSHDGSKALLYGAGCFHCEMDSPFLLSLFLPVAAQIYAFFGGEKSKVPRRLLSSVV